MSWKESLKELCKLKSRKGKPVKSFLVTTSYRPTEAQVNHARRIAKEENLPYIIRNKRSLKRLMNEYNRGVIVCGTDKITVNMNGTEDSLFFHPNAAMLRVKRWLHDKNDPFIEACGIEEGDIFVDATLGLGSDAILASLATGKTGRVIGIEQSFPLAFVVKEGLSSYDSNIPAVNEAFRRIEVIYRSHLTWLKEAEDKSADIVYFDPMFTEKVTGSDGFDLLRPFAIHSPLVEEVIVEAKRVARKRVVLKDHFRSERFQLYGFHVHVRPSATYHFGRIEMEGN